MNGVLVLILFDSGVTRSFVSLALRKRFGDAPGELDYLLEIEIADDHPMRVSMVYRGYDLELFNERYVTDLVHIPFLREQGYHRDWLVDP